MRPTVLIIDDDPTFCLMLKSFLTKKDFATETAFSGAEALNQVRKQDFDVVLSDFRLPDTDGLELLENIREIKPGTPVIIMTSYADIRIAVKAMKIGAYEYVTKPVNPDEILLIVRNALNREKEKEAMPAAIPASKPQQQSGNKKNPPKNGFEYVEGNSVVAKRIMEYIDVVAPTNLSVIIHGESGTGKEYVAKMIHQKSNRSHKPFVSIDCGTLSKELAASELFGHIKGSFTGAIVDKTGQFVFAEGGTLFLDEIGNLTYEIQVQLLRAIQERRIRKIGSNQDVEVDVRIIVATNEDLQDAVKKGNFREDLYHRLNEFKIIVPSLRDREDDINIFAEHFLQLANAELNKDVVNFDDEVKAIFRRYSWPGNLRELRNVVRRAVLLTSGEYVRKETLPHEIVFEKREDVSNNQSVRTENKMQADQPLDLKSLAEKTERELIINTLIKVNYNKSKAAALLKIDRKTLYNKMKLYKILTDDES
ncbi:MAG TPA: sigma-54 dependent transcriptional regulator [Chitinophagales bacterium]|nr:sigma-54 dependent transcriptional regulator [Chitinophagales bacterium]HNF70232.1 sigma-54 dependent transcriptional regulator [Chitinophagales bacterium]HNI53982.1 sigma-54 dependent transcriptional regulator [Chitinophagales bacterium]